MHLEKTFLVNYRLKILINVDVLSIHILLIEN